VQRDLDREVSVGGVGGIARLLVGDWGGGIVWVVGMPVLCRGMLAPLLQ
jgi:hypothetical protein